MKSQEFQPVLERSHVSVRLKVEDIRTVSAISNAAIYEYLLLPV
jgi:hypothetical protein